MAIITATAIIRSLSLFHLIAAYFLYTSPTSIPKYGLVNVIGAAMGLPTPSSLANPNAATALLATVLALLSTADLTAASLHEDAAAHYWGSQAPVRLLFFFVLTGYSFMAKPGGWRAGRTMRGADTAVAAEGLSNSVVFAWGFVEMMMWFWIYVTLRDERRESLAKAAVRKSLQEERDRSY